MVYADYNDIIHSLDENIIAQLCSDTGIAEALPNDITTAALERGSGMVRAYCRVGNIYTDADLTALAAADDPLLIAIVVDLAAEFLFQRRGTKITPAIEQRVKQSYSYLEALRDGKMLFGDVERNATAGTPSVVAVPVQNLYYYNEASNSPFFPPRLPNTYPA